MPENLHHTNISYYTVLCSKELIMTMKCFIIWSARKKPENLHHMKISCYTVSGSRELIMTMECFGSACFPLASSTMVATAFHVCCLSTGVAYMQPAHVRLLSYISMPISLITITFSLCEFALTTKMPRYINYSSPIIET